MDTDARTHTHTQAALRTVVELVEGRTMEKLEYADVRGLEGIKEATVTVNPCPSSPLHKHIASGAAATEGLKLRVAVANGLGNAKKLITAMKAGETKYDFIEVMACPGGCIGGGGQPRSTDKQIVSKRQQAMYSIDERKTLRRSHENPIIKQLYEKWLGSPNSHVAHEKLHTMYVPGGAE
ncbi:hypothetical protein FOA52_003551 [Chlamydomonas sp. UWO 241]|nr:hypothetical protein FOA52_003551 [Chlamydomonas sp. UWO 241]